MLRFDLRLARCKASALIPELSPSESLGRIWLDDSGGAGWREACSEVKINWKKKAWLQLVIESDYLGKHSVLRQYC